MLPHVKARVIIETGVSLGWHKYAGDYGKMITHDKFGASAPLKVLMEKFDFTAERVVKEAMTAIESVKS